MVWARFDDSFPEHPKVLALTDRAFRLHVTAICYSTRILTDGHIPAAGPKSWGFKPKDVQGLIDAGLWEEAEAGYAIHDFLEYNPSRDRVGELRGKRAMAGKAGGMAKALANARPVATPPVQQKSAPSQTRPDPIPFPDPPPPESPPPLGDDDDGFRERYGTLALAFGDPRERRLIDEFVQIANDATLQEIREGIAVVRRAGQKPYPSKVWAAISELRTPAEAAQSLEDFMESMYEPA